MNKKLEFSLVPVSGTLKEEGGYRAKFGKKLKGVLDLDDVLREAKEAGAFFGVSTDLAKLIVRGVLQTMIDKTAEDGVTRRIDDYLTVSLKVRGKFESKDDDFDPARHALALSVRPLAAFRPKFNLKPVNVDHKRQFRIYSITAADGSRPAGKVVWRKDFRIKGADLLQENGEAFVACQMKGPDGTYFSVNPVIASASSTEIVCHWPEEYDEGYQRGRMNVSVDKYEHISDPSTTLPMRDKMVTVYPE